MSEFSLIEKYFSQLGESRSDVAVGVGDDAALVTGIEKALCVCVDTLVEGVHFPHTTSAEDVGYKSLAVNLSDFAAMGAVPCWVTLALTLSDQQDEQWVAAFARGFHQIAQEFGVQLIGGDTTRGKSLVVTVQLMGACGQRVLKRSAAETDDAIYVTGTIGDAYVGLQRASQTSNADYFVSRLNRPLPRIDAIQLLKPFVNAAIDVSDGLLADLQHILNSSKVGATIRLPDIPVHPDANTELMSLITGGDDYELCFTVSPQYCTAVETIAQQNNIPITRIGVIEQQAGLRCVDGDEDVTTPRRLGYQHFEEEV